MDAFKAEKLKHKVQALLLESNSPRQKILIIKDYYYLLISDYPRIIIEAYLNEFFDEFLKLLKNFEVFYFKPQITREIIQLLEKLKEYDLNDGTIGELNVISQSLNTKLVKLNKILNGEDVILNANHKVSFPILEIDQHGQTINSPGLLETFSIDIRKNPTEDSFIIASSSDITNDDLINQIKISWVLALKYVSSQYSRINKYHKVIVHFDNRLGSYSGSSFGAALTISFIEELINFHNLSVLISIKENIALTGGFDKEGILSKLDERVLLTKLEVIFYSDIRIFVVPDPNKYSAIRQLDELKQLYPKRNLIIIGVTDLQDLLNRRNLIDVKKQNPIVRSAKFTKRNLVAIISILLLLLITGYFYIVNYDDNPAILDRQGQTLFVENKSGTVLYSKTFAYRVDYINSPPYLKNFQKLIDMNNDGRKELLAASELPSSLENGDKFGSITCYDYRGKQIWNYLFQDTISSPGEVLSKNYISHLIDTATVNGEKVLVAYSQNNESFGSAIYMLDLKTGKRVYGTFWHPGFISGGFIIKSKDKNELVFDGWNNSWNKLAIGMLDLNDINGKAPSDRHHDYYGKNIAAFKHYILIPDEDYRQIITPTNLLRSGIGDFISNGNDSTFLCDIFLGENKFAGIVYRISKDFKNISIIINDDYARLRDPYVISGKLKPPLSDTQAYRNLLISQILYWDGNRFVKKN